MQVGVAHRMCPTPNWLGQRSAGAVAASVSFGVCRKAIGVRPGANLAALPSASLTWPAGSSEGRVGKRPVLLHAPIGGGKIARAE